MTHRRTTRSRLPVALTALALGLGVAAQIEAQQARAADRGRTWTIPGLGTIAFPNSGAPAAQEAFIRGVLLLHSFEYEDARAAFVEAQRLDPDFALTYWGEAMTFNHPLWAQQDRGAALQALAKLAPTPEARRARAPTDRERMLLAALDVLYGEGDKRSRDRAYMEAMRRLHEAHPEDAEAATFYALSVLGSVPQRDFRTYMKAGAIAEEVFARNPDHPGAAHYLIHSYDDPIHAPLGLRAARRYAKIAPSASHAQHMVSHIYTALGLWDDVVAANRQSVAVSEERLQRLGRPLSGRNKHSLLWLEYGLLQQGRVEEAREALATMEADARERPHPGHLYYYAAMRAAYAVADPSSGDLPEPLEMSGASLSAVAQDAFASGLRFLAAGDLEAAHRTLDRLTAALESSRIASADEGRSSSDGATSDDDLLVAGVMARELESMLLFRAGETDRALELLRAAAADEESRALEYGPPSIVKPSRELLGEMLLALDRPAEADAEFEKSLARNTRRALSLRGRYRAAVAAGNMETAEAVAETIRKMWRGETSALLEARTTWLH